MIKIGIVGAAGYTAGELLRILINHPEVEIAFCHSRSHAGEYVHHIHEDLFDSNLKFTNEIDEHIDVIFLCLSHGESMKFLRENKFQDKIKIIDLANDFRLKKQCDGFVYGLTELNRDKISKSNKIANPGCFATCIALGLIPLAQNNLLQGEIFTTGITGSTGAGQSLSATSHFSWRNNNIQAYKTLNHQHLDEIGETLNELTTKNFNINFVPWRGDFTRGIFVSTMVKISCELSRLYEIYQSFYKDSFFVKVVNNPIHLKQVVNTNNALINLEYKEDTLVIHSCIDNLIKGASGQAVQNMNVAFGIDERCGLQLKCSYF